MSDNLFADFPYTTPAEWLTQIEKDLKSRTRSEMRWSPDSQLNIDPFVHAEDVPNRTSPFGFFGKWQTWESFVVEDARESNQQILEALSGGVESLQISCKDNIEWELLLADVELPFIHVGLEIHGDARQALTSFIAFAGSKYHPDDLSVSLQFSNRESPIPWIAAFPFVRIGLSPGHTTQIAEGLCSTIHDTLVFGDWNPERLSQCNLSVTVGMHYLVEIARLRALRTLWTNVSSVLRFSLSPAFSIEAKTTAPSIDDGQYSHMIRSTIMGLAAVLGGADRIEIQPAAGANHSKAFYRHIARNIHHLLRLESKFSEITDPVAGAYYIDQLTHDIVEKTWEMLVHQIEK